MLKQRIKHALPFLIPLRKKQRLLFFYWRMRFDKNQYAKEIQRSALPCLLYASGSLMYNEKTGFPMQYQANKVFNLKLAAAAINHVLIRPGETFSFWRLVRHADRYAAYKDGLVLRDGALTVASGGGLCQLSNLLFWLFLHSPLTIVERHAHKTKEFPEPSHDTPLGVDATVSEGYLDVKVKNNTGLTFQIHLNFDATCMYGSLLADRELDCTYEITNNALTYYHDEDSVFEQVDVMQRQICRFTECLIRSRLLYTNHCKIGYTLPEDVLVRKKEGHAA